MAVVIGATTLVAACPCTALVGIIGVLFSLIVCAIDIDVSTDRAGVLRYGGCRGRALELTKELYNLASGGSKNPPPGTQLCRGSIQLRGKDPVRRCQQASGDTISSGWSRSSSLLAASEQTPLAHQVEAPL